MRELNIFGLLGYFRDSLADIDRCSADRSPSEMKLFSRKQVLRGHIEDVSCFDFQESKSLDVTVYPLRATVGHSHQSKSTEDVFCVAIQTKLTKEGFLSPEVYSNSVWIPREHLEPQISSDSKLTLGHVDDADNFLSANEIPSGNWHDLLSYIESMLDHVCRCPYQTYLAGQGWILDERVSIEVSKPKNVNRKLIRVYDYLLKQKRSVGVLAGLLEPIKKEPTPPRAHLGQFRNNYELSPSQREALHHHLAGSATKIICISGPPGTGKTTLIQSAIASRWVEAAINDLEPPIIVGTSTNNPAVTNLLASLDNHGEETFDRWLLINESEPLKTFGIFSPATSVKPEEIPHGTFTLELNKEQFRPSSFVFDQKQAKVAESYFLSQCSSFLGTPVSNLSQAKQYARSLLLSHHDSYKEIYSLTKRHQELASLSLENNIAILEKTRPDLEARLAHLRAASAAFSCLQTLSFNLTSHFRFLKSVQRYRKAKLDDFCLQFQISIDDDCDLKMQQAISSYLRRNIHGTVTELQDNEREHLALNNLLDEYRGLSSAYSLWHSKCEADSLPNALNDLCSTLNELNNPLETWLDKSLRFKMFVWSTRYYEARFIELSLNANHSLSRENQIRLLSYVFPCIVTTLHNATNVFSIPSFIEAIDLLIVDEAGQTLPANCGPIFALTKEALLLGDTQQLQPVSTIPKHIDAANMLKRKLIAHKADFFTSVISALSSSRGNLLSAASLCGGAKAGTMPMLREHRRSVPEIIAYCNELAYNGELRPTRQSVENGPWGSLAYAHFNGVMQRFGKSRRNPKEAKAIVDWLIRNRPVIEHRFSCNDLSACVAILTPFGEQARALRDALRDAAIKIERVGTVHVMQGAEKPLVLFSPVYDATHEGPLIFDRGVNMLNVAVSRARDHFIVIGNMSHFNPKNDSPSGLLARHLFRHPENEITDIGPSSHARANMILKTLQGHREALKRGFSQARNRLLIVSPFLARRAIEADKIIDQAAAASARGVKITIYFDPYLAASTMSREDLSHLKQQLKPYAQLKSVDRVHAKLIAIDDRVLVEGSFNWLSASRDPNQTRFEVSHVLKDTEASEAIDTILVDLRRRESRDSRPTLHLSPAIIERSAAP